MALRILLGVDDSPYARAATKVALDLASRVPDSELTAIHVVNVVAPTGSFLKDLPGRLGFEPAVVAPEIHDRHTAEGEALLGEVKLAAEALGVTVKTVLETGAVLESLTRRAHQADLLVIGHLGHTETRQPGQGGGNVYNVVASAPCPVLLVPKDGQPLREVVIGYDGSPGAVHAVGALRRLTDVTPIEVHAVLVDNDRIDPSVLDQVADQLPGTHVQHHVVKATVVRDGLVAVAESTGANVVALGFGGNSRLRDFLFGSTCEYLLTEHSLALLVAH